MVYLSEWLAKYLLINERHNLAIILIEVFRTTVSLLTLYQIVEREKVHDDEYIKFIWLFNLRSAASPTLSLTVV